MSQSASQALARKWRPKDFESLVGQEHVVKALSHALHTQRLHHAYLLTGTRGVGKTTIARILAKAVNCEEGVSAKPCGVCRACTEISQGRFVDLLEVDAATNTRVDEMRQLLENAAYAPTAGRFKVYVIDEVHMLSNSSFNAMLKTLEEPPEHILFVLATTDPQKIPPTVLSRCLQFGLRQLAPDQIFEHLSAILQQESIEFEPAALRILAKAARGSLRDALSLTDQAIAFSAGHLAEATVRQMLGSVDQQVIVQILEYLAARDGASLIALTDTLATQSAPFGTLLEELAAASYRLSVAEMTGELNAQDPDQAALLGVQGLFTGEDLQLFYQIATHARSELHLAPEEHIGFSMALIRMMCFRPGGQSVASVASAKPAAQAPRTIPSSGVSQPASSTSQAEPNAQAPLERAPAPSRPEGKSAAAMAALAATRAVIANRSKTGKGSSRQSDSASAPAPAKPTREPPPEEPEPVVAPVAQPQPQVPPAEEVRSSAQSTVAGDRSELPNPDQWPEVAQSIPASGIVRQALVQTELLGWQEQEGMWLVNLKTAVRNWADDAMADKLKSVLSDHFARPVRVSLELGEVSKTASLGMQAIRKEAQQQALQAIEQDPFMIELKKQMGARIVEGSLRPLHSHGPADV
ncbi:MAG: DNA polymerase III subunit gamma/tau [Limnobacter sp.]|nr:DNA polymerase III subunit gamma/tau [Limnobacter sp.]